MKYTEQDIEAATSDATDRATRSLIQDETDDAIAPATLVATFDAIDDATRDAIDDTIFDVISAATKAATDNLVPR